MLMISRVSLNDTSKLKKYFFELDLERITKNNAQGLIRAYLL